MNTNICHYIKELTSFNSFFSLILDIVLDLFNYMTVSFKIDTTSFIDKTKNNLTSIINLVSSVFSDSFGYINYILGKLIIYFNILLETSYQSFMEKLKEHQESVKSYVKNYIDTITGDLTNSRSLKGFNKIIEKLESEIGKFDKNNTHLHKSYQYSTPNSIMKSDYIGNVGKIFIISRTMNSYINAFNIFKTNKSKFNTDISNLKYYPNKLLNEKVDTRSLKKGSNNINSTLTIFRNFKHYLGEFEKNMDNVKKLAEIGNHIKTMKETLNQVKDIARPEVKNYITELADITINTSEIQNEVLNIKRITQDNIGKFEIAVEITKLYNAMDSGISNLDGVEFRTYDFEELLKNSLEIEKKLKAFQKINISDYENISTIDRFDQNKYESDVASHQLLITYLLYEVSVLVHIIYYLMLIKENSTIINNIKEKIKQISDLDTALKNLPSMYSELVTFYLIHYNSLKNIVSFASTSSVGRYLDKYLYGFVLLIYYSEILIFEILCYIYILSAIKSLQNILEITIPEIKTLRKSNELKVFSGYVSNIIQCLQSINATISCLNSSSSDLKIENIKHQLIKIRTYINEITKKVLEIQLNLSKITDIKLNLYVIMFKIYYLQSYIKIVVANIIGIVRYLYIYYLLFIVFIEKRYGISQIEPSLFLTFLNLIKELISNFETITRHLSGIKSGIDVAFRELIKFMTSKINNIRTMVNNIESKVNDIDKKVLEVECAIEGVARNMIRCSLKSVSNHLNNYDNQLLINYSMISVVQYNVVVNKLYESGRKLDTIIQLIPLPEGCKCISYLESKKRVELGVIYVQRMMEKLTSDGKNQTINEMVKVHQMNSLYGVGMYGNNLCICMVNKYILYPQLLKLFYLLAVDLEMLSTTSRKYDNYVNFNSTKLEMPKVFMLVIDVLYKISKYILSKYTYSWTGRTTGVEIKCFCTYHQDQNYHLILSIILVISSLIDDIWKIDRDSVRTEVECLSSLLSEFDIIGPNTTNSIETNQCKLVFYPIMFNKCSCTNSKGECDCKCCSITCLIVILTVYLCILCKIKVKLNPGKCQQIKDRISEFLKLVCKYKGSVCCMKDLIKSCEELCNSIKENDCNCEKLSEKVTELCSSCQCCEGICPCKNIKKSCENLCEFLKSFDEKLSKCIDKCCKTNNCQCKIMYILMVMTKITVFIEYNMKYEVKFNFLTLGSLTWKRLYNNIEVLYVCYNKSMISMTKNSYITHFNTYTDHKNIANRFPSLTMGYGYESVY